MCEGSQQVRHQRRKRGILEKKARRQNLSGK